MLKKANYLPRQESLVGTLFPRTCFAKEWRSYIDSGCSYENRMLRKYRGRTEKGA